MKLRARQKVDSSTLLHKAYSEERARKATDRYRAKLVERVASLEALVQQQKEMLREAIADAQRDRMSLLEWTQFGRLSAKDVNYPDGWDTAAYPTLQDALLEITHDFKLRRED